jgi:hypothetical protein
MFKYLKKVTCSRTSHSNFLSTVDIMEKLLDDVKSQAFVLSMIKKGCSPDKAIELCMKLIEAKLHKQSHDGNFISNTYFKLNITLFFD